MNTITTVTILVQILGILVGIVFTAYMVTGLLGSIFYRPEKGQTRAENVRLVITTIASETVRDALMETISHTLRNFDEYEIYCVLDEGSDLQDDLTSMDEINTIVVPDTYERDAIAKGRAINYFIETVVSEDPEYWYGFLDDDNLILDEKFLYEIPHCEANGYRAMNPVLIPRQGRSLLTFMTDHIRLADDIAVYRLFTGILGRPYLGFHGELLCARGDILTEIGFDRETIVEDFAFALELAEREIPVWQSATHVSVLSPHDVTAFLKQRARWYIGIAAYLPQAPLVSQLVVGSRMLVWSVAVTSSWFLIPLWLLGDGISLPLWFTSVLALGAVIYVCTIGIGARRIGGVKGALLVTLTPIYAMLEHIVPLYAMWKRDRDFVVIDK